MIDDKAETGETTDEKIAKLVFTSNFDGPVGNQIKDLCTIAAPIIDRIYECCEEYPSENERTTESRIAYLNKWFVKTTTFYKGSPGRSMKQIKEENNLRNYIKQLIETKNWSSMSAGEIHQNIQQEVFSNPEFTWAKKKYICQG